MEADGGVAARARVRGRRRRHAGDNFFCLLCLLSLTFYLIAKDAPRAVGDVIDAGPSSHSGGGGADDGAGDDGVSHADGVGPGCRRPSAATLWSAERSLGIERKRDASDEIEGAA